MNRNRFYALLFAFFGVALLACGPEFKATPADAGTGGDAAAGAGGTAGSTGGTAGTGGNTGGSSGSTSSGGGGTGGNTGGTGGGGTGGNTGGGGTGGGNPCPDATADGLAAMLGKPCGNLFPQGCGTQNPVPRGDFINAVIGEVPASKLQGFTLPANPTFQDVDDLSFYYPSVERAVWLEIIAVSNFFHPSDATTTCFAQDTVTAMNALPDVYAVVFYNASSGNLSGGGGPSTVVRMNVYGTSPANHLTQLVRVANNLSANFKVPQATGALEAVVIRCQFPDGSANYTPYSLPLDGSGKADFSTLDCYNQASGAMELQLQMDPAVSGVGQQARIGVDPGTLPVHGGQSGSPTKTIN